MSDPVMPVSPARPSVLPTRRAISRSAGFALAAMLLTAAAPAAVVVEEVGDGGALSRAGLLPGDVLERWRTGDETLRGPIRTWVDWHYLFAEIVPLPGDVLLTVRRGEHTLERRLGERQMKGRLRAALDAPELEAFRAGWAALSEGRVEAGMVSWQGLLGSLLTRGDNASAVWLADEIVRAADRPRAGAAKQAVDRVLAMPGVGLRARALLLVERARLSLRLGQDGEAPPDLSQALEAYRQLGEEGLSAALAHYLAGYAALGVGDPSGAERSYRQVLKMRRHLIPDSMDEAAARIGLGQAEAQLGRLREAERQWLRALELYERLAPEDPDRAGILGNLGIVACQAGDWRRAESYLSRSLDLPGTDLQGGLHRARTLTNLGELAMRRRNFTQARDHYQAALEIKEALDPEHPIVATSLRGLAEAAFELGDVDTAEKLFGRVAAWTARAQPGTLVQATAFSDQARVLRRRGEERAAEKAYEQALAVLRTAAPRGLDLVHVLQSLGELALAGGDLERAGERFGEARRWLEKSAVHGSELAQVLGLLAEVRWRQRDTAAALELSRLSVEALEGQLDRFGAAPGAKSRFRSGYERLYRRWLELLVEQGRTEEAFAVLERSRARGLLELISSRHLRLRDAPDDLERRRLGLIAEQDRLAHRLATVADDDAEHPTLLAELAELQVRRQRLADATWLRSPRVAAWRSPRPLEAAAARRVLLPGTLYLAWSVGEDRTTLFALQRSGPALAFVLDVGESSLRHRVDRFIAWSRRSGAGRPENAWREASRRLGAELLGPVAEQIRGARRLLLSPDGPLHRLPFAALTLPDDEHPLVSELPILHIPSATVLAELSRAPSDTSEGDLVAFGVPSSAARLAPLEAAAAEAQAVADLFPASRLFLGAEATEEQWKAAAPGARWLHFAGHALTRADSPLDSALVFHMPGEMAKGAENGLLEAWEVFEQLRLEAELVVLSACGTALGEAIRGEGLLGLERAFLFAGAQSVMATLWPISDAATHRFMERFYRHLRAGLGRDEALRQTQLETMERGAGGAPTPAHWAAFRLTGQVGIAVDQPGRPPTRQGRRDTYE